MDKLLEHLRTFLIAVVSAGILYGIFSFLLGPDSRLPQQQEPIYSGSAEQASESTVSENSDQNSLAVDTPAVQDNSESAESAAAAAQTDAAELDRVRDTTINEIIAALDDSDRLAPPMPENGSEETAEKTTAELTNPSADTAEETSSYLNTAFSSDETEFPNEETSVYGIEDDYEPEFFDVPLESAQTSSSPAVNETNLNKIEEEPVDFFDIALHEAAADEIETAAIEPIPAKPELTELAEPFQQEPVLEESTAEIADQNSCPSDISLPEESTAGLTIPMLEIEQVIPPQNSEAVSNQTEIVLEETPAEPSIETAVSVETKLTVEPELTVATETAVEAESAAASEEKDINIYSDITAESQSEETADASYTFAPVSLSSENPVSLPEGTEAAESIESTEESIPAESAPETADVPMIVESAEPIAAADNEVWFLDSGAACGQFDQIRFWQLADRRFVPSDAQTFSAKHSVPTATVVLIHGNLSDTEATIRYGMTVKYRLDQIQAMSQTPIRYRLVIWKWPSEKMLRGIRSDSQMKAYLAEQNGYTLAALLETIPQDEPVTLIGFSFGVRTIGSGLSILQNNTSGTAHYNLLFLAAAADAGSFTSCGKYAASIPLVNQMVNIFNPTDKALKFYPLLYKGHRVSAIGTAPITVPSQALSNRAFSINSSVYGPEHRFSHYFAAISNQQLETLVFGPQN